MNFFGGQKSKEQEPLLQASGNGDVEAQTEPKQGYFGINWLSFPYASLVIILFEIFQLLSFMPVVYLILLKVFDSYILSWIGTVLGQFYEVFVSDKPGLFWYIIGMAIGLYSIITISSSVQKYIAERWGVQSRRILTKKLQDNYFTLFGFIWGQKQQNQTDKSLTEDCEGLCQSLAEVANDLAGVPFQIFYNTFLVYNIFKTPVPVVTIWIAYVVGGFIYWLVNKITKSKQKSKVGKEKELRDAHNKKRSLLEQSQEEIKEKLQAQKEEEEIEEKEEQIRKKAQQEQIEKELAEDEKEKEELQKKKEEEKKKKQLEKKRQEGEKQSKKQDQPTKQQVSSIFNDDNNKENKEAQPNKENTGDKNNSGLLGSLSFFSNGDDLKQQGKNKEEINANGGGKKDKSPPTKDTGNKDSSTILNRSFGLVLFGSALADQDTLRQNYKDKSAGLDEHIDQKFHGLIDVKYQVMVWTTVSKAFEGVLANMGQLLNYGLLAWYIFIYNGVDQKNPGEVAGFVTNSTFYVLTLVGSLTAIFGEVDKFQKLEGYASHIGDVLIKIREKEELDKQKQKDKKDQGTSQQK